MCTLARNSWCAMAPPMSAAAMLSRKDDSTKIITSSAKPPFQPSGRKRGSMMGMRLFSKCRDSREKPTSSSSRLMRIVCSWCRWPIRPLTPGTGLEAGKEHLVTGYDTQSDHGDRECVVVQQSYTDQRSTEENELDRYTEHSRRRSGGRARCGYRREHATQRERVPVATFAAFGHDLLMAARKDSVGRSAGLRTALISEYAAGMSRRILPALRRTGSR